MVTQIPHGKGHRSPLFSAHDYCGQTVAHLSYWRALVNSDVSNEDVRGGEVRVDCVGTRQSQPHHGVSVVSSRPPSSLVVLDGVSWVLILLLNP